MKRLLVVVLMCAFVLAAAPATANAHVMKQHRAAYMKLLAGYPKEWTQWDNAWNIEAGILTDLNADMQAAITAGDRARLTADETQADGMAQTLGTWLADSLPNLDRQLTSMTNERVTWFKSKSDKAAFRLGMGGVKSGFDTLFTQSFGDLVVAADDLHNQDFPDYITEDQNSSTYEGWATSYFDNGMATLKKLL